MAEEKIKLVANNKRHIMNILLKKNMRQELSLLEQKLNLSEWDAVRLENLL